MTHDLTDGDAWKENENGEPIDEPLEYAGWRLHPDGRLDHSHHDGAVLQNGAVDTPATVADARLPSPQLGSRKTTVSLSEIGNTWTERKQILPDGYKYPTVLHATSVLDNPIDTWYVYSAPYDTDYIDLLSAPAIEGPYTNQGTVITAEPNATQADAPHVLYDPLAGELKLWYHENGDAGTGQAYTLLATSSDRGDGTSWTKYGNPTPVLDGAKTGRWDGDERSYMTCQRVGNRFIGIYQGRDVPANERGIGICWSADGINWETSAYPFGWNQIIKNYNPQKRDNLRAPTLLRLNGELVVLYNDYSGTNENVNAFSFNQRADNVSPDSRATLMTLPDGYGAVMGDSITVGTRQYLLYDDRIGYFDWGKYQ